MKSLSEIIKQSRRYTYNPNEEVISINTQPMKIDPVIREFYNTIDDLKSYGELVEQPIIIEIK